MNIELKPIAQKKLDQMAATVHGVLVKNEAGAWAAVSDAGRVMWLDGFEGRADETRATVMPSEHGKNRYGLDMAYFRELFNRELNRPLADFRPDELARVLARAARTADAAVLQEPEFQAARAQSGQEVEPDWSASKTLESEGWKNPLLSKNDRLQIADGAVAWRDEVIKNLRSRASQPAQQGVPEAVIKAAVEKFMQWKLPEDFYPDGGVSFDRAYEHDSPHWPVGTNILTAEQAEQMFRECLAPIEPQPKGDGWAASAEGIAEELVDRLFDMREGVYRIQLMVGNMYCESGAGGFNKQALLTWMTGTLRELLPAPTTTSRTGGAR